MTTSTAVVAVVAVVFADGWFGPDPGDRQGRWAAELPGGGRVAQDDWHVPERRAWLRRLDEAVASGGRRAAPVLVVHGLGVHDLVAQTVVHWAAGGGRPVRGALFVTPADVELNPDPAIRRFAPVPETALPFPSLLFPALSFPACRRRAGPTGG